MLDAVHSVAFNLVQVVQQRNDRLKGAHSTVLVLILDDGDFSKYIRMFVYECIRRPNDRLPGDDHSGHPAAQLEIPITGVNVESQLSSGAGSAGNHHVYPNHRLISGPTAVRHEGGTWVKRVGPDRTLRVRIGLHIQSRQTDRVKPVRQFVVRDLFAGEIKHLV